MFVYKKKKKIFKFKTLLYNFENKFLDSFYYCYIVNLNIKSKKKTFYFYFFSKLISSVKCFLIFFQQCS